MPEEHGGDPNRKQSAEAVVTATCDVEPPQYQRDIQENQQQGADKTPLFGKDGEGEVSVLLRQKAEL